MIDGDINLYQACQQAETETQWDDRLYTIHSDIELAKNRIRDDIAGYIEEFNADNIVVALSDTSRGRIFRKDIWPTYKENRKNTRKPIGYWDIVEWCKEEYNTFERPTLEGDDILGILATSDKIIKGDKIVISLDKDMNTIPCHFSRSGKKSGLKEITEQEANYYFMLQTLTGDTTDGYCGLQGCGPVAAKKILDGKETLEEMWEAVVAAYVKGTSKGKFTEEAALIQARCARILRNTDYDFKDKQVKLWSPS